MNRKTIHIRNFLVWYSFHLFLCLVELGFCVFLSFFFFRRYINIYLLCTYYCYKNDLNNLYRLYLSANYNPAFVTIQIKFEFSTLNDDSVTCIF